jgi:hypothetical protein
MTATDERETGSLVAWAAEAEAAAGIARALATTAFLPDSLKVYADAKRTQLDLDATVAQAAAALLTGQELGLSPMASLRSIDVIPPGSGSPALRAAALRGLVQHHGHDIWIVESTQTRAVVRGVRAGTDIVQESVWTLDRAKRLRVRGYADPNGSWQRQPGVMLVARATAEVARWIASDVLLGLPYIAEEIGDESGAGDEPVPEGDASANHSPGARPRRRATRAGRSPARPGGALALPVANPETTGESAPAGPPITGSQRARLWAGLKRLGLTDRDEALDAISRWIGRGVTSSNDLTTAEASVALEAIQGEQDRRTVAEQDAADRADAERAADDAELPQEPPGE